MKAKVITKSIQYVDGTVYLRGERIHEIHLADGTVIESRKRLNKIREQYEITQTKTVTRKRQIEP